MSSLTRAFGLCRRWIFTNGASELTHLLRRWLVGELAVDDLVYLGERRKLAYLYFSFDKCGLRVFTNDCGSELAVVF